MMAADETFALDLRALCDMVSERADAVVRKVTLDLGTSIVYRSPVGNPELWAHNAVAAEYNRAVFEENRRLRSDPANLNKAGRLKPGLKVNDSMEVKAPKGYVGGHFRGNWQFGDGIEPQGVLDVIDPQGAATVASLAAAIATSGAGGVTYIVNNLPYAVRLENGWSKQAPQGMVRLAAAEFQSLVNEAVRAVDL